MSRRALLVLLTATLSCRTDPGSRSASPTVKPDVLLLTVDTLRPDALSWAGGKEPTPAIDRLAAEGFRFPAAVAPVPLTLPSHAALMTGWWPRRLGLQENGQLVPPGVPTLAEAFRDAGYARAAFVSPGLPARASRVPLTNSTGTCRRGKCSLRGCSGRPAACSG